MERFVFSDEASVFSDESHSLLRAGVLAGFLFNPEDGGDAFL